MAEEISGENLSVQGDSNERLSGDDIERQSYSKYMLKRVQKLRKKGLHYGVTVPKLNYVLDKPEKERTIFKICAYVLFALAGLMAVATIAMYAVTHIFSVISQVISASGELVFGEWLEKTFGITGFLGIGLFFSIFILIILVLLPIYVIYKTIRLARKNLALATVSKQEMAQGYEISWYLTSLIIFAILALGLGVFGLVKNMQSSTFGLIFVIFCLILAILFAVFFVFLLKERSKEKQWFQTLPQEKQQDFISHNKSLRQVKFRRSLSKRI